MLLGKCTGRGCRTVQGYSFSARVAWDSRHPDGWQFVASLIRVNLGRVVWFFGERHSLNGVYPFKRSVGPGGFTAFPRLCGRDSRRPSATSPPRAGHWTLRRVSLLAGPARERFREGNHPLRPFGPASCWFDRIPPRPNPRSQPPPRSGHRHDSFRRNHPDGVESPGPRALSVLGVTR